MPDAKNAGQSIKDIPVPASATIPAEVNLTSKADTMCDTPMYQTWYMRATAVGWASENGTELKSEDPRT